MCIFGKAIAGKLNKGNVRSRQVHFEDASFKSQQVKPVNESRHVIPR